MEIGQVKLMESQLGSLLSIYSETKEVWARLTVVDMIKGGHDLNVMLTGFGARFGYRKT